MAETKTCPHCGKSSAELLHLDADMKGRLSSDLGMAKVPDDACASCFSALSAQLSRDAQKKSRRAAKEQHRLQLWRSRVQLIREARDRVAVKDYAGAVVAYEKYFRVLEIIYEVKPNEIQVSHFNNSARSKELVVIASAYWDLMRIYDQSKKFQKRLDQCAEKLGQFLPFTPIYGEIVRKIEEYKKVSKNREAFDRVLKVASKNKKRCFIATAAFESADALPVEILAAFRDQVLVKSTPGRMFIGAYYMVSPPLARLIDKNLWLRKPLRPALSALSTYLAEKYNLKTHQS